MTWVTHSLKTSGHSNDSVTRSLKTSGRSNGLVIPIIASLWIFCRMTWKMSYAEFHLFEPSSQCFQHLFDFICTILSALNSYFTLLKQPLYTSNCGTQAFWRWRSLIGWKTKLKISYVHKMFQKKPKHFCSPNVYIKNEIFFCQWLVLHKKIQKINKAHG